MPIFYRMEGNGAVRKERREGNPCDGTGSLQDGKRAGQDWRRRKACTGSGRRAGKEVVEIKVNAFEPVSTFDISQTDGEPVPRLGVEELTGSVEGYATLMEAIKQASPVPISFESIESGAKQSYIRLHCLRTCVAKRKNLSLKLCTYVIMALKSRDIMEALWNLKNIEMKLTIFLQLTAEEVLLIIIIAEVCGAI